MTMLCVTIAKLGGCREEKMITFPASFRSSNYNCHTDDLVSEVHYVSRYNKAIAAHYDPYNKLGLKSGVNMEIAKVIEARIGKNIDKFVEPINFFANSW